MVQEHPEGCRYMFSDNLRTRVKGQAVELQKFDLVLEFALEFALWPHNARFLAHMVSSENVMTAI